jgi:hypothetical protein
MPAPAEHCDSDNKGGAVVDRASVRAWPAGSYCTLTKQSSDSQSSRKSWAVGVSRRYS